MFKLSYGFMKSILFVCLMVMGCAAFSAHAVTATVPENCLTKAQAQAITFKWKDASGTEHTNSLADRATDPRHIVALLKEVYTNKDVPGIYYRGYAANGDLEGNTSKVAYGKVVAPLTSDKYCGWGIKGNPKKTNDNDYYKPNKEGYTLLMVAVKDDFKGTNKKAKDQVQTETALVNYIGSAIESVQLITDGQRKGNVNEFTSGTVFTLSGSYNRFFFLSKGKCVSSGITPNYPFCTMFEEFSPYDLVKGENVGDFYQKMINGETLNIEHDCGSVLEGNHYFSMNGNSNDNTHYDMTGLNLFIPDFRMAIWNGRDSDVNFHNYNQKYAPSTFMYAIKLTGDARPKDGADHTYTVTLDWTTTYGSDVAQTFSLYPVVDGDVDYDNPILLNSGNTFGYSYDVPQQTSGYTLTFVVRGNPDDADFDEVSSNRLSVIIPGYDPQERLKLEISGKFESEYDLQSQRNRYANYIIMNNGEGTSVTRKFIDTNSKFELHRYEGGAATPEQADKIVATLHITGVSDDRCSYELSYAHQEDAVESKYPASTGTFKFDNEGNVLFDNFTMCDQFSASTADNDHRSKYTYQIRFESATTFDDIDGNPTNEVYSNITDVNVYKVDYDFAGRVFTREQVDNDKLADKLLPVSSDVPMAFTALNDQNVLYYNMVSADKGTTSAFAQNTNDGSYISHNSDGSTRMFNADKVTITDNITEVGLYSYVQVIETYRNDNSGARNTYGSDIKILPVAQLTAAKKDVVANEKTFTNANGQKCRYYRVDLGGTVTLPEGYEIYALRVWRDCGDKASEVKDEYKHRLDQTVAVWDKEVDDQFLLDGDEMIFGALDAATYGDITCNFTLRLYFRPSSASSLRTPSRAAAVQPYYISEQKLEVTLTGSERTAVEDVTTAATVVRVRYIDLAGRVSNTPFAGLNLVVTEMSDGSLVTTKAIF